LFLIFDFYKNKPFRKSLSWSSIKLSLIVQLILCEFDFSWLPNSIHKLNWIEFNWNSVWLVGLVGWLTTHIHLDQLKLDKFLNIYVIKKVAVVHHETTLVTLYYYLNIVLANNNYWVECRGNVSASNFKTQMSADSTRPVGNYKAWLLWTEWYKV